MNNMKREDIQEMPLPNRKIYQLIWEETGGNVKAFSEKINVSQQVLNRLFNKDTRNGKYPLPSENIKKAIMERYDKTEIWFITNNDNVSLNDNYSENGKGIGTILNYEMLPVIHLDSVGGMHSNNSITDEPQYIERYVPFVNGRKGDLAIYQSGDSMSPTIPAGSLIHIREVKGWRDYFGYGNIYVIVLKDGRRLTKEIAKYENDPKNYVLCKSHNPKVADEPLPKNMIDSVWKVINVLINQGW